MKRSILDSLQRARNDKTPVALVSDLEQGTQGLIYADEIDDPALIAALGSEAFYIGALGSRRTHSKRVERLIP